MVWSATAVGTQERLLVPRKGQKRRRTERSGGEMKASMPSNALKWLVADATRTRVDHSQTDGISTFDFTR